MIPENPNASFRGRFDSRTHEAVAIGAAAISPTSRIRPFG